MCLKNLCFDFKNFSEAKVAIFISGPGNLEFPWALETALRLKHSGAQVEVFDISDYALRYSARIKLFGKLLPVRSRKILRGILLKNGSRIENRFSNICDINSIPYVRKKTTKKLKYYHRNKFVKISNFTDIKWGMIEAHKIIHTHLSSKYKKNLAEDDLVPVAYVQGIKDAIMETLDFVKSIPTSKFSYYFVCNGRQPVQAALSTYLRSKGGKVFFYEGGGGYIFPELLNRHIDYWETSPANYLENQSKILCPNRLNKLNLDLANKVVAAFQTRSFIPFALNFLTDHSSNFNKAHLGPANNYAYFATSQHEFSIFYKYEKKAEHFQNQIDAVQTILNNINLNDKLFIRLHPSDPNMPTQHDREWNVFRNNGNVIIIDSDNRLNSYDLAKSMTANFVWESTIGFELAVTNLPVGVMSESAVYAPCMPENCLYNKEQLRKFLVKPKSPRFQPLLYFANYLAQSGFQIKNSHEESSRRIFLLGKQVDIYKKIFKGLSDKIRINIT